MNNRIYDSGIEKLRNQERVNRLEVERVVNLCLKEKNIKTLLDIGTGSGLFAESFSKAGILVSGIDLNEEMIEAAKKYLPNSDFKIAPAENIPYEDNSFDASLFGLVYHEVSDYKKALSEAFRVSSIFTFILEWQYKTEDFGPPIEHRLNSDFIKNISEEAGFRTFIEIPLNYLVFYQLGKELF